MNTSGLPGASQPSTAPRLKLIETSAEQAQLASLLTRSFEVQAGRSFYDDFPVWDPRLEVPQIVRFGIFLGEKLACAACARVAWIKAPHVPVKVALIGGVATEPELRGHGLASQAVSVALKWAEQNQAALCILWGSEHSLYRKLGFELCGSQVQVPLSALAGKAAPGAMISTGYNPLLFNALKTRESGLAFADADRKWIEAHKNVNWYWMTQGGRLAAYAAIGRGIDLGGLVHEWGGDPAALRAVFSEVERRSPGARLLASPEAAARLLPGEWDIEYLMMAKVLRPGDILASFKISDFSIERGKDSPWLLNKSGFPMGEFSDGEIARVLFGPDRFRPFESAFPLPIWIWGLDGA